ncbi:MAG: DUF368 domain-containing protein [Salinispira sp.]
MIARIFINFFKGTFIGIANVIPGVSGGTIAVITGVYEPLVGFFGTSLNREWPGKFRNISPMLFPVMFGMFAGILLLANLIDSLFIVAPSQIQFFFIGLILGSAPYVAKQGSKNRFKISYLIVFLLAAALLIWMGIRAREMGDRSTLIDTQNIIRTLTPLNAVLIISTGILTSATMLMPGVSGAFVMVLIGMYATYIVMIEELNFPIILTFLTGAIAGLFLCAKIISTLLNKFHGHSYYTILGLMIGSISFLWPGLSLNISGLASLIACLAGFLLAFFLSDGHKKPIQEPQAETASNQTDGNGE